MSRQQRAKGVDNSKAVIPPPATIGRKIAPFTYLVRSAHPFVWVVTPEYDRFYRTAYDSLPQFKHFRWNCQMAGDPRSQDPLQPINSAMHAEKAVVYLENYHRWISNMQIMQTLLNSMSYLKEHTVTLAVVTPLTQSTAVGNNVLACPPELMHYFVSFEFPLPDAKEIEANYRTVFTDVLKGQAIPEDVSKGAVGLTIHESENALGLSLVESKKMDPQIIYRQKANILKASKSLRLLESTETLDELIGLENLKEWSLNRFKKHKSLAGVQLNLPFRGILLVGVPGCGKSHFAKALGKEVGRPTIQLDLGAVYSSGVGESETNIRDALKRADAMEPCNLFVDEMEKQSSGMGSSDRSDAGTSARVISTWLTWLQDHTSDVFVIATCNNISALPVELTRAGRWDAIFWIGLPHEDERKEILNHYCKLYRVDAKQELPDLTGWTGAEIRQLAIQAAYADGNLENAMKFVIPLIRSQGDQIEAMTREAEGRYVMASAPPKEATLLKRRLDAVAETGGTAL